MQTSEKNLLAVSIVGYQSTTEHPSVADLKRAIVPNIVLDPACVLYCHAFVDHLGSQAAEDLETIVQT